MALGLSSVVLAVCVTLVPCVFAGRRDCDSYRDFSNVYHPSMKCYIGFCCGSCSRRYCCQDSFREFSEDKQEECFLESSPLPMVFGISSLVAVVLIVICCCVCPCCCLYKMCRKPQPVIATTTHTTVVTGVPQQYPRQPTATPNQPQSFTGAPYPPYQPVPVQPGYGTQPMAQNYGAQPLMTTPYHGPPFTAGPPPTYQEATGPCYPPQPMPYSQAAFTPDQPAYSLQPASQPHPNVPPTQSDFLAQPAYNPHYVSPPPKTG